MAKRSKEKSRQFIGGPHLSAALFCDQILEEKDGTLSAIRIIDSLTLKVSASTPADQTIPIGIWMLLAFKSGDSPGKHEIRVDMRSPSGKLKRGEPQTHEFSEEPHGGFNLRLMNTIMVKNGGVFWADAHLDGKPIAHAPLSVTVERVPDDAQPSPSANGERAAKTKRARKTNSG